MSHPNNAVPPRNRVTTEIMNVSTDRPAIMLVHDYYLQRGGEDYIFEGDRDLLERRGHRVIQFTLHNDQVQNWNKVRLAVRTVWNRECHRDLFDLVVSERPAIVQFHNTLPLVSPAGYWAAKAAGAVVVQNIQNFRLVCPNANLLRKGSVCEDCLGRLLPWPGVWHRCYRRSITASAAVAAMLTTHRVLKTWRTKVDVFTVPTDFMRAKLVQGGVPAERIYTRPNIVDPDPGFGTGDGNFVLFVGRLSHEKGLETLIDGWRRVEKNLKLKIIGSGPLEESVRRAADDRIEYLGRRKRTEALAMMREAKFLVVPSICYEASPVVIAEAFATGLPVLASNQGAMASLVEDGLTGRLFETGNPVDLATKASQLACEAQMSGNMRKNARSEFEKRFNEKAGYVRLTEIYQLALDNERERRAVPD
jgi:glycosyltransferase involved in cell wall biosynthesis